jgi:ribosomal-protein-alanine N-acetyltransferase
MLSKFNNAIFGGNAQICKKNKCFLMKMILPETQRLLLREFVADDAESLYLLNLNPEVIRYTGDIPFIDIDDAAQFLNTYDDYTQYGYGRWAMIERETSDFLGWCGLKFHPEENENDIGFRLFQKHWNKGFATEAAGACIDYGFQTLKMNSIIGRAMRENTPSIHVLEKVGLQYERPFDFHGGPGVIYRIVNSAINLQEN